MRFPSPCLTVPRAAFPPSRTALAGPLRRGTVGTHVHGPRPTACGPCAPVPSGRRAPPPSSSSPARNKSRASRTNCPEQSPPRSPSIADTVTPPLPPTARGTPDHLAKHVPAQKESPSARRVSRSTPRHDARGHPRTHTERPPFSPMGTEAPHREGGVAPGEERVKE